VRERGVARRNRGRRDRGRKEGDWRGSKGEGRVWKESNELVVEDGRYCESHRPCYLATCSNH